MDYWQGPSRWINAALLFIVGVIAFDAVFLLLGAQESNAIVGLVDTVSGVFMLPFDGMFPNQPEVATQGLAVLGWLLLATIALAVVRSVQAGRSEHGRDRTGFEPDDRPAPPATREAPPTVGTRDRPRR